MADLTENIRQILEDIEFPFDNLPRNWAIRSPKVILSLGRLRPEMDLHEIEGWDGEGGGLLGSRDIISYTVDH